MHHNLPVYGHPGINKMYQLTCRRYWWPNMHKDVMSYIRGCMECQRNKINTCPTKAPLQPIYLRSEAMPFKTVTLDFITKLPISQGYDLILIVMDHNCLLLWGTPYLTSRSLDEVKRERELVGNLMMIQKDQAEEPWSTTQVFYTVVKGFKAPSESLSYK